MQHYFDANTEFKITADFSHWTCVSESMLDNFSGILDTAFTRTAHVHARIGYEEGPQVTDFRAPEWAYATNKFFSWWDKMVDLRNADRLETFTFTTEFGPFPYLPSLPYTRVPVVDLFEINCAMKDLLKARYSLVAAQSVRS